MSEAVGVVSLTVTAKMHSPPAPVQVTVVTPTGKKLPETTVLPFWSVQVGVEPSHGDSAEPPWFPGSPR
jgi:hypothetical protein